MKLHLILSFVLLGTVSSFHLKNEALKIETPEEEESQNQEQETSEEEEILTSGEGDSWEEKEKATELVPVPAIKEDINVCPKEEDVIHLTGSPECQTCRYLFIRQAKTFQQAQFICQSCYRGKLVSIHNFQFNLLLQTSACGVNQGQVWIGASVSGWDPCLRFTWLDGSRWDFTYWAPGHPGNNCGNCVALCTRSGYWRRAPCVRHLPFFCSY
ncbi:bone marrow proteoglycan-like [Gracilinanus agilis]|uniref:bone marrow proteoglycan-like n=1 Tax=Gracilinanus agilis TaxID=191870 RepID=UPI001CFD7140|nr:bone marrow proteoglycan-like [Gracilinanus agilis]